MKKLKSFLLIVSLLTLTACQSEPAKPQVNLVYYKLYENNSNFQKILDNYQRQNPHINIIYKNFTDAETYYSTIINEIAEGRGPDIMSVHNTWVGPNLAKLTPAPTDLINPTDYRNIFLNQAAEDNIFQVNNVDQVYGLPLQLDNLALYYNQAHFERSLPQDGKPGDTWSKLQNQAQVLTNIQGNNLTKSGLALGQGDGILRSSDIFYQLLLQTEANIYNSNFTEAALTRSSEISDTLDFITSFTNPESTNQTWSNKLQTNEKEIGAFLKGDTSMIFGYSYLYNEILNLKNTYDRQNIDTIDISDIKITASPQINPEDPIVFANYYTEVVSRNSKNAQEAWSLIGYLSSQNTLTEYYQNNFKVSPRRDMVETQSQNRIYAPFIKQVGITKSIPIIDQEKQKEIIETLIDQYPTQPSNSIREAENNINQLIQGRALRP